MTKIIRLTESDLTRIVKRVIEENSTDNELKIGKYITSIERIVEPFKNDDIVCDIKVKHQYEEDNDIESYIIEIVFSTKGLDNVFLSNSVRRNYKQTIKNKITKEVFGFLPIRFWVKERETPNCSGYFEYLNKKQNI